MCTENDNEFLISKSLEQIVIYTNLTKMWLRDEIWTGLQAVSFFANGSKFNTSSKMRFVPCTCFYPFPFFFFQFLPHFSICRLALLCALAHHIAPGSWCSFLKQLAGTSTCMHWWSCNKKLVFTYYRKISSKRSFI